MGKLKAKHIRKIRSRAQLYFVTDDDRQWDMNAKTGSGIVLAYYPEQAINRLRRRNHQIWKDWRQCDRFSSFQKYTVQPVNKPFERFKTYWK